MTLEVAESELVRFSIFICVILLMMFDVYFQSYRRFFDACRGLSTHIFLWAVMRSWVDDGYWWFKNIIACHD